MQDNVASIASDEKRVAARTHAPRWHIRRSPVRHDFADRGIEPLEASDEAKPDHPLVLPWNLEGAIVHQMRHVGEWDCRFTIPIPEVHLIDPARGAS